MNTRNFDLYIDESGRFEDLTEKEPSMSLVGGVLMPQGTITEARAKLLPPEEVHCCKKYDKRYLNVLETLRQDGTRYVIFQNQEQTQVLNGDTTYLNILAEGLVQLLSALQLEYPNEDVHVNVVIATKKNMETKHGIVGTDQYKERVREKVELAKYRCRAVLCEYELHFGDARKKREFDFADIVCNTYFTQRRPKFTDEERERIVKVFDGQYIYSVFESATVSYLKQLLIDGNYSEMVYQICTLTKLQNVKNLHRELLKQITAASPTERAVIFQHLSLQIRLYVDRRLFTNGISFAENYQDRFLFPLQKVSEELEKEVGFWLFDTDFYIVTMYNHLGHVSKCAEYLKRCNDNIHVINRSWEHIDYYFNFKIRELNCLKGCFDFEAVQEKAKQLINVLTNAKELFGMIDSGSSAEDAPKSELLGKAYGLLLETYLNLVGNQPALLEEALTVSDLAMQEFTAEQDLQRQKQNRSTLLLVAGKPAEALDWLLRVFDLSMESEDALDAFIACVYQQPEYPLQFPLWHYTDVMLALGEAGDPLGRKMFEALTHSEAFARDIKNTDADSAGDGYPRNLTLWNLSRYYRMTGAVKAADTYFVRARNITKKDPVKATLYSFSLSMEADTLKWRVQKGDAKSKQAYGEMDRAVKAFCARKDVPDAMKRHFMQCADSDLLTFLTNCSRAYLR
ncbi:MAG: hypothetical protein Q4B32_11065 [Clostridia bacterium]|nr:hypothetical protein [Clostridia bacterium]